MAGQRGMVLAVALLLVALALTLAAAYLIVGGQSAQLGDAAYRAERAYQAADAGLNLAAAACSAGESACLGWTGWSRSYPVAAGGPSFLVTHAAAAAGPGGDTYQVTATGSEALPTPLGGSGRAQRQLKATFRFDDAGRWLGVTYRGSS